MINKTVEEAINKQLNAELYSAYLYYSMAAYFESLGLKGFAHWLTVQALEEMAHVGKFFNYVNDRGGRVKFYAVEGPPTDWETPLHAFDEVYSHEQHVTGLVNGLLDLAIAQSDHATNNFLQWFVSEQVEEEANASEIVQKLKLVDSSQGGLFLLDQEMGKRPFVLPPQFLGAPA